MRVLIVAATSMEIAPLVARFDAAGPGEPGEPGEIIEPGETIRPHVTAHTHAGHVIHVLETGVGMVPTAVWCARELAAARYDVALNLGLCGTFDPDIPLGAVVHVAADEMPELGAEDGESFLTLQELRLTGDDAAPFAGGRLVNGRPPSNRVLETLPSVRGITVNTVHGSPRTIAEIVHRVNPQVESMEGAAFMYACLVHGVEFAQVRAVSNRVERRDRAAWKISEAIAALTDAGARLLEAV